ncbi:hypothetical protein AVEN_150587-1 [Araneus ventricosus]|uniref:Uncharacterized protein n=1 Tax=Araneus ventricosus TaxID=182803 RepID=A0A4Y2KJE9_ARAVE|nr:hypothetical protein AVEN_150587-1 [Araneus ventricosus]
MLILFSNGLGNPLRFCACAGRSYFHQNRGKVKNGRVFVAWSNKELRKFAHMSQCLTPLSGVKSSKSASLGILKRPVQVVIAASKILFYNLLTFNKASSGTLTYCLATDS